MIRGILGALTIYAKALRLQSKGSSKGPGVCLPVPVKLLNNLPDRCHYSHLTEEEVRLREVKGLA